MAGPELLRIKRKRDEPAPNALFVQQHKEGNDSKRHRGNGLPTHYIRQKSSQEESQGDKSTSGITDKVNDSSLFQDVRTSPAASTSGSGTSTPSQIKERRIFHLRRPAAPEVGVRKRRFKEDGIATFIEQRAKHDPQKLLDLAEKSKSNGEAAKPVLEVLKRPGKGSSIKASRDFSSSSIAPFNGTVAPADEHLRAMANSLHHFAIEEAEKESTSKTKLLSRPRLPPQRSRELHRQRASQASANISQQQMDVEMAIDDDADYIYETYVLASTSDMGTAQVDAQEALGDVGYLIITEEDQAIWESYIEEEPSDKDWNTDEDDENAEDWYGADYPDDELASDDEYDRNAYGYRANRGSDDEEWDEDTGAFSDDEYERQMNPFASKKTPRQFAKYFDGVKAKDEE